MGLSYNDTIAGIATAPGEAGIGIIRISGDDAISIASMLFRSNSGVPVQELTSRKMVYGWIESQDQVLDEVLLCVMRKPASFTAEDVVEIHCHGGNFLLNTLLTVVLENGARLARPGEFTQRAFLNGRIDLTQAEAINDIIQTQSRLGLNMVINQLKGRLYDKISAIQEEIAWVLALVNAGIDFPEEDTVFTSLDQVIAKIKKVEAELRHLIRSADTGIKIREGYKIVLAGKPNVGKSRILNGLLEESRAIVNQTPGTTRDTIEESCAIHGIPVSLIDTAGIHDTADEIEKEGIQRALTAIERSDLILWVIDNSNPSFEIRLASLVDIEGIPMILVLNKRDLQPEPIAPLPESLAHHDQITISALENDDIDRLRHKIYDFITGSKEQWVEETMLTNLRQKVAAQEALDLLRKTQESIEAGIGEELIAVDLNQVLRALGEIVGETTPDDMLNKIFAEFCIGK